MWCKQFLKLTIFVISIVSFPLEAFAEPKYPKHAEIINDYPVSTEEIVLVRCGKNHSEESWLSWQNDIQNKLSRIWIRNFQGHLPKVDLEIVTMKFNADSNGKLSYSSCTKRSSNKIVNALIEAFGKSLKDLPVFILPSGFSNGEYLLVDVRITKRTNWK